MAVPFSDIYGIFSNLTTDYKHLQLPAEVQDAILQGWLVLAINSFKVCKEDLADRDDMFQQFNQDITPEVQSILAKLMIVEWMSPKLYSIDLFKNNLTPKDWNTYSPANLLQQVRETYLLVKRVTQALIKSYDHANFDLTGLVAR